MGVCYVGLVREKRTEHVLVLTNNSQALLWSTGTSDVINSAQLRLPSDNDDIANLLEDKDKEEKPRSSAVIWSESAV
jgi:hypothetical protein